MTTLEAAPRPQPASVSAGQRHRLGFAAGVAAALAFVLAVVLLRLITDVPSVLEIVADGILFLLPGALFSVVLDAMQHAAKPLLYLAMVVGTVLVGGLLGRWYAGKPSAGRAASIAGSVWLIFGVGIYTVAGAGLFGQRLSAGPLWHGGSLLALFAVYGLALYQLFQAFERRAQRRLGVVPVDAERRSALWSIGGALVAVGVGGGVWRAVMNGGAGGSAPPEVAAVPVPDAATPGAATLAANPAPFAVAGVAPEITPVRDFYTVSKNFIDPSVDVGGWRLRIDGMVDHPIELTYDQLRALPASEGYYTLMCISNEVGGDLWGNARWKGVKLHTLLEQAGVQAGVVKAVFTGADDYKDSVTVDRALHPDAFLAWEMDGAPLAKEHGFPARLLIPGIYGMKNVKWLRGITLVSDNFKGYWQARGWDDGAPYQTASRIDVPRPRLTLAAGPVDVGGVAFAGDRGIQKVEVSADQGQTWQEAQVKPGLSPYTWQLWSARVDVAKGVRSLQVRATDGAGHVQVHTEAPPFPAGSTGYHTVDVGVTG